MVRRSAWLALASCVLVGAGLVHAGSAASRTTQPFPIVYGYPYASKCPLAGVADVPDRWKMDTCNCTSYVAWALEANGQRTDWFVPGAMDARNWPHVARLAGIRVGSQPRAGAVAVWPRQEPPFGHVAYVTRVDPDGGFDVSEYNAPGSVGRFDFDRRFDLRPAGAEFIYVPRTSGRALG